MDGGEYVDRDTGEVIVAAPVGTHRWSSPCGELFAAMALAQAAVENVEKGGLNPAFRAKYAKLGDVLDEVRPKFAAQGISITQMPINGAGSNIGVVTLFAHKSGQWLESTLYVAPTKFDAQGAGSVITYLRRYALMAMAGVAPDDDDGNAAVGRPSEARTAQGSPHAAPAGRGRPQAAPAPSDADLEATRLYKAMQARIDEAVTVKGLETIVPSQAWKTLDDALHTIRPADVADASMGLLRDRIEAQRQMLLGGT
jgi:hypothetical protein